MSFEDWNVDLIEKVAKHSSGFTLRFEGHPKDPSAIHPGPFPQSLSSLDQVRLLRQAMECIACAPKQDEGAARGAVKKPVQLKEKMADYKPSRPVLSLKKKADAQLSD